MLSVKNMADFIGGIDKVIPVDVYVPGCPAKPEAIIDGVVMALEKFDRLTNEYRAVEPEKSGVNNHA